MGQGQSIRSTLALCDVISRINKPAIAAADAANSRLDERACRWAAIVLDESRYRTHAERDISRGFYYARRGRFDLSRSHFNRALSIIRTTTRDGTTLNAIGQAFPFDTI